MNSEHIEEWRDVVGYEGRYQVSSLGRVRSVQGGRLAGGVLLPDVSSRYPRITLFIDGKRKRAFIHVLVAAAFIGQCPSGKEINHKDGDKLNATPGNLEYITRSENAIHAYHVIKTRHPGGNHNRGDRHWSAIHPERVVRGERMGAAKLTESSVREMRTKHANGESTASLAREYGVTQGVAWRAVRNLSWRHVI